MNFKYCPKCGQQASVIKHNDTYYSCTNCTFQFWNNPKVTVTVAVLKGDQILTATRGIEPRKGKLDIPGGFADYGESAYDAAAREALEEMSIHIKDPVIIDTYAREYCPGITICDTVFAVTEWKGEPQANDDVLDLHWNSIDVIDSPDFAWDYPGLAEKLKLYQSSRQEPLLQLQ